MQTQKLLAEVVQTYDAMNRLTRRAMSGPGVIHPAVESWEYDVRAGWFAGMTRRDVLAGPV